MIVLFQFLAAKLSALSSGKVDKYEFLISEAILPPDQKRMTEQINFLYSPLGKAFQEQTKTIDDNYKEIFEELVKERFDEIRELTNEINQNDLI